MLAAVNTALVRQNFIEPLTPFGDVEFINFCYTIPGQERIKELIYRKWMYEYYPDMAKIPYSGTGLPVMKNSVDLKLNKVRTLFKSIRGKLFGMSKCWEMNPTNLWYEKNERIQKAFNAYYEKNYQLIPKDFTYAGEIEELYQEGSVNEKMLALSFIAAIKINIQ